jgi:hypothetical protein
LPQCLGKTEPDWAKMGKTEHDSIGEKLGKTGKDWEKTGQDWGKTRQDWGQNGPYWPDWARLGMTGVRLSSEHDSIGERLGK